MLTFGCKSVSLTEVHVKLLLFSVTPLDVVKIRLQAQKSPFPKGTKAFKVV